MESEGNNTESGLYFQDYLGFKDRFEWCCSVGFRAGALEAEALGLSLAPSLTRCVMSTLNFWCLSFPTYKKVKVTKTKQNKKQCLFMPYVLLILTHTNRYPSRYILSVDKMHWQRKGFVFHLASLCCCLVTKSCPTLCDPLDCNTPGFPVLYYLPESAQIQVHWVSDAI